MQCFKFKIPLTESLRFSFEKRSYLLHFVISYLIIPALQHFTNSNHSVVVHENLSIQLMLGKLFYMIEFDSLTRNCLNRQANRENFHLIKENRIK